MAQTPVIEGDAASAVRVVIYEDLQCSDCADFRKMMDDHLLPKYKDRVAFEHRDFPLPKHNWAREAAIAARYFHSVNPELGKRWRRTILFERRSVTKESFNGYLSKFADKNQADAAKALAALEDAQLAAAVQRDFDEGVARGIARTPTVLVNGDPFIETFTLEEITKSIEAHLAAGSVK